MQLLNTVAELRHCLDQLKQSHQASLVGFVPTMGALHLGHLSLIAQARQNCDIVVVSIFVNPLQFGPDEDFGQYPRPAAADQACCQAAGVDVLFMPSSRELYGEGYRDLSTVTQVVPPQQMTHTLCGRSRPGHFQGVATVVAKLLNIVRPTYAYFGQKDAQQVAILKRLARDLNLPGQVVTCPLVREPDGLALSSRNRYLSDRQRQQATVLYRSLQAARKAFLQGERRCDVLILAAKAVLTAQPAVTLDYLALVHPDTLKTLQTIDTVGMMAIAAYVGNPEETLDSQQLNSDSAQALRTTRLIDNLILRDRAPIIAIDGPAGAGKSTVARQIAHQLGLLYLDTGAMYRAMTWFVLQQGVDPQDERAIAQLLPQCKIQLIANVEDGSPQPPQVKVNGQDVTAAIRTAEVTRNVSAVAAQSAVRAYLVKQQQQYGNQGGIVADGRDIGTQVFPHAELKIYLTASVMERARRRQLDLVKRAETHSAVSGHEKTLPDLDELAQLIADRDHQDSTRAISPLRKAPDAIEIVSDDLSAEAVIEKISTLYRQVIA